MWWSQDDDFVEFFDACGEANSREEGPTLHHFRSGDFKNEKNYLMTCWQECLKEETIIPADIIRNDTKDGNTERILPNYLTGPLFQFPAQRELDLPQPEATELPVHDEQDHCTTTIHCMPSNVIQEPVCDLETAVGLRLIGGEETVAFEDENLLQIPSITNQQQ